VHGATGFDRQPGGRQEKHQRHFWGFSIEKFFVLTFTTELRKNMAHHQLDCAFSSGLRHLEPSH
jgi:hypothetical protein